MEAVPYVLSGIIVLFVLMQAGFWLSTRRLQGRPAPDVSDLLDVDLSGSERVLFYFYSAHCRPCRVMEPRIDRLAQRYGNVFKVNINDARDLAGRFSITVTPSIMVVAEGRIARAMVGTHSEKRLAALLEPS